MPVVTFRGEIAAGAAVSGGHPEVGIEGGVHLTIGFPWNDPNNDGKFRVCEFLQAALNNPMCLFTTTGRLSLFLRVYITLGLLALQRVVRFTLADITLLDFSRATRLLATATRTRRHEGDTLVVFAGTSATATRAARPGATRPTPRPTSSR